MKLMLNCKQASQLVSESLDGPLSWSDRFSLRLHLFICDACTRFNRQLHVIKNAVLRMKFETEHDASIQLSLAAKAKIHQAIDANNH
jgi:hypothetical protein